VSDHTSGEPRIASREASALSKLRQQLSNNRQQDQHGREQVLTLAILQRLST
jgi:hypothetical protein